MLHENAKELDRADKKASRFIASLAGIVSSLIVCLIGLLAVIFLGANVTSSRGSFNPESTPQPTNTKVFTALPTLTLYKRPTNTPTRLAATGRVLLSENFSNTQTTWTSGDLDGASIAIKDGLYQITITKNEWISWGKANKSFSDFALSVDAQVMVTPNTPDYGFGIAYRIKDNKNLSFFEVYPGKYFKASRLTNGSWSTLNIQNNTAALKDPKAVNTLRMICQQALCEFSVNNQKVLTVRDSTVLAGDVGVFATKYNTPGSVRVGFDNFTLWEVTQGVGFLPDDDFPERSGL
ncbi:MAG TPA: hypothetical protein VIO61_13550 [Anaerolineaceae bacterium]